MYSEVPGTPLRDSGKARDGQVLEWNGSTQSASETLKIEGTHLAVIIADGGDSSPSWPC